MIVNVIKLQEDAVLPSKTYPSDFCYDCVAISEKEIAPNVWKYGLGIAFQIERDFVEPVQGMMMICNEDGENIERKIFSMTPDLRTFQGNISIDARPRSSVWKTGMVLSNCEGTIDENYTGEVSAVFYHVMPDMPRYKVGDRVCQIKLGMALPMHFKEVDKFYATDRGSKGYGSTGK